MGTFDSPVPRLHTEAITEAQGNNIGDGVHSSVPFRLAIDCVGGLTAAFGASGLQSFLQRHLHLRFPDKGPLGLLWGTFVVLLLLRHHRIEGTSSLSRLRETETAVRVSIQAILLLFAMDGLLALHLPPVTFLVYFLVTLCLLTLERQMVIGIAAHACARLPSGRPTQASAPRGCSLQAVARVDTPWHYVMLKRSLDMAVSVFLIVLLSPMLIVIALLIHITSPGPALFIQERVGKSGVFFKMYKFRSMYMNAPAYEVSPKHASDPRITSFGRFLRRLSLDELPQLFNVLKGEMSLVGPRPEMPFVVHTYTAEQKQRLNVLPGITGVWQLSGCRAFPIHENIAYDLHYLRNCSIFMDIAILVHTAAFGAWSGV